MVETVKRLAGAAGEVTAKWVRSRTLFLVCAIAAATWDLVRHGHLTAVPQVALWLGVVTLLITAWFGGKAWGSLIERLPELIRAWRSS